MTNVIPLFPKDEVTVAYTCLDCHNKFDVTIENGDPVEQPCPTCKTARTVPYTVAPDPDGYESFECDCGSRFFKLLPENQAFCIKCTAIWLQEGDVATCLVEGNTDIDS